MKAYILERIKEPSTWRGLTLSPHRPGRSAGPWPVGCHHCRWPWPGRFDRCADP